MGHKAVKIGYKSQSGLRCVACNGRKFRVVYIRHKPDESILRRRECEHCGKRVSTKERVVCN